MTFPWRAIVALAVLAFLGWIGFEVGRAGNDVVIQRTQGPSMLISGRASGKRLNGEAWSLDYDTVTMSPDGAEAQIAHVRDGRIHRVGRRDVLMQGDDVTVNTVTNDLNVRGPVTFKEDLGGGRTRTFATTGAHYVGATRTLTLDHIATITDSGATVTVASVTVDFRTGEAQLGRVIGERPGSLR
jgi:hypothetical protein